MNSNLLPEISVYMERLMFAFFTENGDFQITIKTVSSRRAQRH